MLEAGKTKTFLLSLGAQKAGTSWLHDQLNRREDTDFGFLKEYHILDALSLTSFQKFRSRRPFPWKWRTWNRYRFLEKPDRYFNYFSKILSRSDIKLTGDITPSYSCLKKETLFWTRDQFLKRGITTKAVFIMRDPVERILSQQRMKLRKSNSLNPEHELDQLRTLASKILEKPSQRSNYLSTLQNIKAVFDQKDLFIDLYEKLFTETTFQALCRHLHLDYIAPNWGVRVNESNSTTTIPDEILKAIGESQRTTFLTISREHPELNIQQHWPTASKWCT
ncbi:sulfotransferase family protein [Synechococcus sp. MIT S1220]|uniref:sulfotransferase family protein n=1 Tax=Synechococcus sp. MIT S1220 TaxID=3082549 RepID=UPI0039B0D787